MKKKTFLASDTNCFCENSSEPRTRLSIECKHRISRVAWRKYLSNREVKKLLDIIHSNSNLINTSISDLTYYIPY